MFSPSKLKDELFCIKEEKNFLESKYLEQVNEIKELKNQLEKANKEITRLRGEVMGENVRKTTLLDLPPKDTVEATEEEKDDDASSLTEDHAPDNESTISEGEESNNKLYADDEDESEKSARQLRKSAEALLKWADYRSSNLTVKTSKTSTTSTTSSPSFSHSHDAQPTFSQHVEVEDDDQSF